MNFGYTSAQSGQTCVPGPKAVKSYINEQCKNAALDEAIKQPLLAEVARLERQAEFNALEQKAIMQSLKSFKLNDIAHSFTTTKNWELVNVTADGNCPVRRRNAPRAAQHRARSAAQTRRSIRHSRKQESRGARFHIKTVCSI